MRYAHEVMVACDGCGLKAPSFKETICLPTGEVANIAPPRGWTTGVVTPRISILTSAPPGPVNLTDVQLVADRLQQAVSVLRCAKCSTRANDGLPREVSDG